MDPIERARRFLAGRQLSFLSAHQLSKSLRDKNELSLARAVLARMREEGALIPEPQPLPADVDETTRLEAELTSKDPELNTAERHDRALDILRKRFDLNSPQYDGNGELLGTAAGIYKRKWQDLGRFDDLKASADLYARGAIGPLGKDAYAQINAAFLDDLVAAHGVESAMRGARAAATRERILRDLPVDPTNWWNVASRAEALLGLGRYADETLVLKTAAATEGAEESKPAAWKLQTTMRQLGHLALLRKKDPLAVPDLKEFFETLLPSAPAAACSAVIGKVGLALSGGGFRASFYHLGVLARLAESDVLRQIEVLSCVSGGSIVGACYWLALRQRMLEGRLRAQADYVAMVRDVIERFQDSVATDLRGQIQPSTARVVWNAIWDQQRGAMDPERGASKLAEHFYQPFWSGARTPILMGDLPFAPADHAEGPFAKEPFHPTKHNWLRDHKVPVLVINSTTVNTGHGWQFTPHWMGEAPWANGQDVDSVPRLEWSYYDESSDWRIELARAVAASACVPFIFAPLEIKHEWERDLRVQLVDGGVYDNQGSTALLAHNCNVVLVSDACGQLKLQEKPDPGLKGLGSYAMRSMDTLMERIRLANYADLDVRRRSGFLRGLMFLHMKSGLSADTVRRKTSQASVVLTRRALTTSGVRRDLQQSLAELRTDLNAFSGNEAQALMACGYLMADHAMERDLTNVPGLLSTRKQVQWPFHGMLETLTSLQEVSTLRDDLLGEFAEGSVVRLA